MSRKYRWSLSYLTIQSSHWIRNCLMNLMASIPIHSILKVRLIQIAQMSRSIQSSQMIQKRRMCLRIRLILTSQNRLDPRNLKCRWILSYLKIRTTRNSHLSLKSLMIQSSHSIRNCPTNLMVSILTRSIHYRMSLNCQKSRNIHWYPLNLRFLNFRSYPMTRLILMNLNYRSIQSYPMIRLIPMIHCCQSYRWTRSIRCYQSCRLSRRNRSFRWIQEECRIQMIHCHRSIPRSRLNPRNLTSHLSPTIQRNPMSPTNRYCRMIRSRIPHNRRLRKWATRQTPHSA